MNDYYNGNPKIKGAYATVEYTQHELEEYVKCMNDVSYFASKYVKVINLDHGIVNFVPRPYQKRLHDTINSNRNTICLSGRQSGKSISLMVWALWYLCFNKNKTVAILANKGATARELLSRLYLMLENLPFFLQPGTVILNKGNIKFANGSEIFAAATSSSSIRGRAVDVLILDEFAFVKNDVEFFTSTVPVVASGKNTKIIITSTPNGIGNLFYRMWNRAITGANTYSPVKIEWWEVPGRDAAWREKEIANTSELQFSQEYECKFLGSSQTLISADSLVGMIPLTPLKDEKIYKIYKEPEVNRKYIMLVDVAKGRGKDYSTFNIIDVTDKPFRQAAVYRDNQISPLIFPDLIVREAIKYNDALVIVESNDMGAQICKAIYYDLEYENLFTESWKSGLGVTMTSKVKRIGTSNLKDLIEHNTLVIDDAETIIELSSFEAKGDSYAAAGGCNDDLAMNLVLFAWFSGTAWFEEYVNIALKELIWSTRQKAEMPEEEAPSVGYVVDQLNIGSSHINPNSWLWD